MWGTLILFLHFLIHYRFIPTHVGNTQIMPIIINHSAVHPHACGEHGHIMQVEMRFNGSSPRMWGTRFSGPRAGSPARFIPTHVGNTSLQWSQYIFSSVHPHACGEHGIKMTLTPYFTGSSPRMWGTQHKSPNLKGKCRFIPTHVGNTAGPSTT